MDLVQDCQKVILTKDLIIKFAEQYYYEKTGKCFLKHSDIKNVQWNEKNESIEVSIFKNYRNTTD